MRDWVGMLHLTDVERGCREGILREVFTVEGWPRESGRLMAVQQAEKERKSVCRKWSGAGSVCCSCCKECKTQLFLCCRNWPPEAPPESLRAPRQRDLHLFHEDEAQVPIRVPALHCPLQRHSPSPGPRVCAQISLFPEAASRVAQLRDEDASGPHAFLPTPGASALNRAFLVLRKTHWKTAKGRKESGGVNWRMDILRLQVHPKHLKGLLILRFPGSGVSNIVGLDQGWESGQVMLIVKGAHLENHCLGGSKFSLSIKRRAELKHSINNHTLMFHLGWYSKNW